MTRAVATLILTLALLAPPAPTLAQNAHDLFQQALLKERVGGDVAAAIVLYRRILAEHPQERTVVASALVRLGRAHESRDPIEAERMYARVVSLYADQAEAAEAAREGLAALRQAASALQSPSQQRLRELPVPWPEDYSELSAVASLSNDGTRIAHVDRDDDLAIYDLRTNRSTKLIRGGDAWYPVWSPDDSRIAYQRVSDPLAAAGGRTIEIVTIETGAVRATGERGYPRSWARNGTILAISSVTNVPASPVRLLPEAGGEVRSVAVDFAPYDLPVLSPDGAYLAYASNVEGNIDIYVAPTAGGERVRITSEAGVDSRPMWSPDGAHLMFKSDRTLNRMGLWMITMSTGRPEGRPVLVRPDVGEGEPVSWSRDGKLLFSTLRSVAHVYSIEVAPPFELRGSARQLTQAPDWNREPFVSPDGKQVVYHGSSGNNAGAAGRVLRVMGIDGSDASDVVTDLLLPYRALAGWLNDEEVVVASSRRSRPERGLYAVSTRTGALRPILVSDDVRGYAKVSPDRSQVLFLYGGQDPRFHVIRTDGTGLTRVTSAEAPDGLPTGIIPSWSPDSRWIAYVGQARAGVVAVNPETREQRQLVPADSLVRHMGAFWTPDGRYLVYDEGPRAGSEPASFWVKPSDGSGASVRVRMDIPGVPEPASGTGLFFSFFEDWQWAADGSSMVFSVSTIAGQGWIMESFLPERAPPRN